MFITAVCGIFLLKLRWPKGKSLYDTGVSLVVALVAYEVITINSCYALVGYFIISYPTWAHGIIVIY